MFMWSTGPPNACCEFGVGLSSGSLFTVGFRSTARLHDPKAPSDSSDPHMAASINSGPCRLQKLDLVPDCNSILHSKGMG